MWCWSGSSEKQQKKKEKNPQVRRETQRQSDFKKVQSSMNQNQNRAKQQLLNVSLFQTELDGELKMNSKTLKQYMRLIDKVTTFEQYHSLISNHPLEIVSKSICAYFEKILGKNEDHGLLAARLCEPYQLYAQIRKSFKFITLGLVYFLQKIDEGMSEEGLRMDCDFQNRKRQLRQNEAYICERIQAILKKENIFRGRIAEKQQRIRSLKDEINLKDQLSIFNVLSLATSSERNIEDIIFVEMKRLLKQISQFKEEYRDETMKQFIIKIVDFSKRIEQFMSNKSNGYREKQKIQKIVYLSQKEEKKETVLTNKLSLSKPEQMIIDTVSTTPSSNSSQMSKIQPAEIKRLQAQQIILKRQNLSLKSQVQKVTNELMKVQTASKAKDADIQKINTKYNQMQKMQKNKNETVASTLSSQNQQLRKKIETQDNNIKKIQNVYMDQQKRFKQQLAVKQSQIQRLKHENSLLIKTQKDQISKVNSSSWQISQLNALHKMEMKKLEDKETMLNKQNSTLKIEAQRLQKYIKQIEASCKAKDEEVTNINAKIRKLVANQSAENQKNVSALNAVKQQLKKKNETQTMLFSQIQTLTEQNRLHVKQLEEANISLEYEISKTKKLEESMSSVQKLAKSDNNQKQRFRLQYEEKIKKLQQQISSSKLSNQSMLAQLNNRSGELSKVSLQIEKEVTAASTLKSKLKDNEIKVLTLIQQLQHQKQNASKLRQQNEDLIEYSQRLQKLSDPRMMRRSQVEQQIFFIGDLLENDQEEKKFLYKTIQQHMKKSIDKTRKLYEYKMDRLKNFHQVIDNRSNIVIIIRTDKALLAGYYSGVITDKVPMTEDGLILSLTNKKYYTLNTIKNNPKKDPKDKKVMRGMIYDKFFLIVGNAEIRVRSGQDIVFSNFGIAAAFYDNRRDRVDSLLCEGTTNEVKLINYEIHEVVFDETVFVENVDMVQ